MAQEKKYLDIDGLKQVVDIIDGKIEEIYTEIDDITVGQVECDTELSTDSEKPVQNKVIKEAFDDIINGTTPVGNALKLNGLTAEEFVSNENLIPYPYYQGTRTANGVTVTDNGDGTITVNGTSTASVSHFICKFGTDETGYIKLEQTATYTLHVDGATSPARLAYRLYKENDTLSNGGGTLAVLTSSKAVTFTGYTHIAVYLFIESGYTFENQTIKPMLNFGTVACTWRPYHLGGAEHALDADTVDNLHANELFQNHTTRLTESTTLKSLHSLVDTDGAKVFHYVTSAAGTLPSDFPSDLLTDGTTSSMFDVTVKRIGGNGYYTIEGIFTNGVPYKVEGYLSSTFYWRRTSTTTDLAKYLPIDGSVPITGAKFMLNNGKGHVKEDSNCIMLYTFPSGGTTNEYNTEGATGFLAYANNYAVANNMPMGDRIQCKIDNVNYKLLHTGNMASHVLPLTGGTLSGDLSVTKSGNTTARIIAQNDGAKIGMITNTDGGYGLWDYQTNTYLIGRLNGNLLMEGNTPLHTGNYTDYTSPKASTITGLSISGKTITYTKGDGTTGTLTTQDTNTDTKVKITANAPTATTNYYPLMHTGTSGTVEVTANANTRFQTLTGTASAVGTNNLILGNSTASGTAGNSKGQLLLYGTGAYYTLLQSGTPTAHRTITLPDATGTVALTGHTHNYLPLNPASIELTPASGAGHGGFLDFHFNGSSADNTSRIIESASGTLNINGVTVTTGKVVTATTFNGALTGTASGNVPYSGGVGTVSAGYALGSNGAYIYQDSAIPGNIYFRYKATADATSYSYTNISSIITSISGKANSSHTQSASTITTGTFPAAVGFANGVWNPVGDDAYWGDQNIAGCVCIKGNNGATGIHFVPQSGSTTQKISINGSGMMSVTGALNVAASTAYTTNQVRNTVFTTTDPGAGASTTHANGSIICVYE